MPNLNTWGVIPNLNTWGAIPSLNKGSVFLRHMQNIQNIS